MDKAMVIDAVLSALNEQLEVAQVATREASDYATHEESKADSKWDTQGLEASYLAAGQGAQVLAIGNSIRVWSSQREELRHCSRIEAGALFALQQGPGRDWFFLSTAAGGLSVEVDGSRVTVITAQSPIARQLVGRSVGEVAILPNGAQVVIDSIS